MIFSNLKQKLEVKKEFELNSNSYIKLLIGVVTVIITSFLLPSYKDVDVGYEIGSVWNNEDLIAPFSFPIYRDEAEYEQEKAEVLKKISPVFVEIESVGANVKDSLNNFFLEIEQAFKKGTESEKIATYGLTKEDYDKLRQLYKGENKTVNLSYSYFKDVIKRVVEQVSQRSIINLSKSTITSKDISIKKQNQKQQEVVSLAKVNDKQEILEQIGEILYNRISNSQYVEIAKKIVGHFVTENLVFSQELTDLEIQNRIAQVPRTIGIVQENERIVSKHDPINKLTKQKLESYKKIRLENMGVREIVGRNIGRALTITILVVILSLFLYYIRRDVFNSNLKLSLISTLIILIAFLSFLSVNIKANFPVELLIFVPVASILLTIIFDSRLSFFTTVVLCYLIGAIRGGDFTISFISFGGTTLAIFSVRDIKNRSQIFRSFFYILIGYFFTIAAISLDRSYDIQKFLISLSYGAINSIMSPVIAYGLLIFYERVFRITTDLTLLELADFNQPLLKELSSKAPGTFHHSIMMGTLAEEAAAAIGANRILARVGCYYHDIGKIAKPDYFVENQVERINKHENLNPAMSAKVIISHVKDGIEIAKQYKLPQEIIDFIPMHHGTTLVSYFYSKARNVIDEDKEDLSEYLYRYPGPKPQTKETGIAMLADSVEASTKSIEDPTPKKLEDKIDEIIKKRFMEGELDECELTLKDLTKIKKSFLKILIGIYHQRIKYPSVEDEQE
ncbi:MAG: HD family phosphohydrolase [Ignavibacteria bacterium]